VSYKFQSITVVAASHLLECFVVEEAGGIFGKVQLLTLDLLSKLPDWIRGAGNQKKSEPYIVVVIGQAVDQTVGNTGIRRMDKALYSGSSWVGINKV